MEIINIKEALKNYRKGSFCRMGWTTDISTAKARKMGYTVQKVTHTVGRLGVNYNNVKAVVLKKSISEPQKAYTPWYQQTEEPYLVQSIKEPNKKYLKVFTAKAVKPKVTYLLNGQVVSKEYLLEQELCKKPSSQEELVMMTIPVQNLNYIGQKSK